MTDPFATRLPAVIALAATTLVLVLVGLERTPLRDGDDASHALAAREMAAGGGDAVPHEIGEAAKPRPPLYHWLAAGLYSLTGSREALPARLVSALSMIVLVLGTAHLGWRLRDLPTGLRAGLLLATMSLFLAAARQPLPAAVTVAGLGVVLAAVGELLEALPERRPWWWLAVATATGWAVLAGGVALLPFLALIAVRLLVGRWAVRPSPAVAAVMLAVVVLLVVPAWFTLGRPAAEIAHAWFVAPYAGGAIWTREPPWRTLADLTATLPWLALWLGGLIWAWRWRREWLCRLLLWWTGGGLLIVVVLGPDGGASDLLPLLPALALLAAEFWRAHGDQDLLAVFPRRIFAAARLLTDLTVGLLAAALTAAAVQGWLGWPWLALLAAVVAAGWRYDPARRGAVPGLDTQIAMIAVVLLAYHGSIVPRLNTYESGAPFLEEARAALPADAPTPLLVSDVAPALAAFYLETDVRPVASRDLIDHPTSHSGSWLLAPPDVAADLAGAEPALVHTWPSPFTLQTRSLGLYLLAGAGATDAAAPTPRPDAVLPSADQRKEEE